MTQVIVEAFQADIEIMKSVLPSVYIGFFLAAFCLYAGLAQRAQPLSPWLKKISGLSAVSAVSILLSLGDRTAGMAVLASARRTAGITDKEIILTNVVAKAPSVIQFFVFSFVPVMFALYPKSVAIHFLLVYFAAFAGVSLVGFAAVKMTAETQADKPFDAGLAGRTPLPLFSAARKAAVQSMVPFAQTSVWMGSLSFMAMLLIKSDIFTGTASHLPIAFFGVNAGVISAVGAGMVSMLGGVAALASVHQAGAVSDETVVPMLLTISLLHNGYDLFTSSLPRTTAIFGQTLGLKVALISFTVTQAVMLIFVWLTWNRWL